MPLTSWTTIMVRKLFWLVVIAALAVRLYQLPSRAIFTADEEYQATYAKTIVDDFHPIWIGVSAAGTGFYLGPYFTYLTAFLLKLNSDPLILNYAAALLGAVTAGLLYLLGKELGNNRVGVIAALLYAFSPLIVYFDQRYWNPGPVPFLVVLLLLSLIKLKRNKNWLLAITFCLGAFWHVHLSLAPLILPAIFYLYKFREGISLRLWFASLTVFFLMLLPLIIFDYNHAWSNLLTPLRLFQSGSSSLSLTSHFLSYGETLARSLYLTPGLSNDGEVRAACAGGYTDLPTIFALITTVPLLLFLRQTKSFTPRLLNTFVILLSLSFVFYPGPVSPYYLLGLFPLYFLILATLFHKYWWLLLLPFFVTSFITLTRTDGRYSLRAKQKLIYRTISAIDGAPFTLQEAGTCHTYAGWRYLFGAYGRLPTHSSADMSLSWLYPAEIGGNPQYLVIIADPAEFSPPFSPLYQVPSAGYTAYINEVNN